MLLLFSVRARGDEPLGRSFDSRVRGGERTAPAVIEAEGMRMRCDLLLPIPAEGLVLLSRVCSNALTLSFIVPAPLRFPADVFNAPIDFAEASAAVRGPAGPDADR